MDWANEPYVKVYTRETDDDLALSWEARALWDRLITKFDRSGFIETKRGLRGLAAVTRVPLPVVERVIAELLNDGRMVEVEGGFCAPNYMEAQSASKSDKLRQRESRERRRVQKLDRPVTNRDATITNRDETVTDVTLCSADPDPDPELGRPEPSGQRTAADLSREVQPIARTGSVGPTFSHGLAGQGMDELNAIRARVAKKFGWTDVRAIHPLDNARRDLQARLNESGAQAETHMRHVLRIAELEAIAKKTVEYLGGGIFTERSWSKKLAMREADVTRTIGTQQNATPPRAMRVRRDDLDDEEPQT